MHGDRDGGNSTVCRYGQRSAGILEEWKLMLRDPGRDRIYCFSKSRTIALASSTLTKKSFSLMGQTLIDRATNCCLTYGPYSDSRILQICDELCIVWLLISCCKHLILRCVSFSSAMLRRMVLQEWLRMGGDRIGSLVLCRSLSCKPYKLHCNPLQLYNKWQIL